MLEVIYYFISFFAMNTLYFGVYFFLQYREKELRRKLKIESIYSDMYVFEEFLVLPSGKLLYVSEIPY